MTNTCYFLLITTSKSAAETFLSTLNAGDEKLGVKINDNKTVTNFDSIHGSRFVKVIPSLGVECCSIPRLANLV